jgi:peptidoglycan hydrolase-like protein with peptidoglycan-binding domain
MRSLKLFIGTAAAVATFAIPTAVNAQEDGCPVGQYLSETGSGTVLDDVRCLQATLHANGVDSGPVDGWFGPVTRAAVVAFQTAKGLTVDGQVGSETAGALGVWSPEPRQERQQQAAPARQQSSSGGGGGGGGTVWDRLAQCESGGNWSINTGNGYYGGLQFLQSTWNANGGSGNPANASREEQIRVAENLRDSGAGYAPWPACSRKLGLR